MTDGGAIFKDMFLSLYFPTPGDKEVSPRLYEHTREQEVK